MIQRSHPSSAARCVGDAMSDQASDVLKFTSNNNIHIHLKVVFLLISHSFRTPRDYLRTDEAFANDHEYITHKRRTYMAV